MIKTTKFTRTGQAITYTRRSEELSQMVRRGIARKREQIVELTFKRGELEDSLKEISKEITELEKAKTTIKNWLKK